MRPHFLLCVWAFDRKSNVPLLAQRPTAQRLPQKSAVDASALFALRMGFRS